ncbi:MAG: DNA repair protein RecN [Actinobacteria bacterium]|jgi:DNA repair protein RecN (Recombination protein N)|nr:DNA repair protein RecN [Actinomycetota bacterium]MBT3746040.1 DNA repair protein RecN [Actinomycetota bacterium]MBT3969468.1 DNA repair protein RecN [Actinomycetota bacterium]MBT4008953.1 DNA repair protein RecN [Actinomycetota bacterium]MBT4303746.1 DNA repair protein RecN [Actinomycetota bacterium]
MLCELRVTNLGVIEESTVLLGPGLVAVTGETGAGKTMVVGAIELLLGGRADPTMVRQGCAEASVEGRFVAGDREVVLRRVVPLDGRSRAYINGQLATAAALADRGGDLVNLHGQHAHQSLLTAKEQRAALDRFGGIDLVPLQEAEAELVAIDEQLAAMGGDERARAREIDLLRFQVEELDVAAIDDAGEDDQLAKDESLLGDATAHREAAIAALQLLDGDSDVSEGLGVALNNLSDRAPFVDLTGRLHGLLAELTDVASELRATTDGVEEDPQRLEAIVQRRHRLSELRRKYGVDLAAVMAYHREAAERLDDLLDHEARAAALDAQRLAAEAARVQAAAVVLAARRRAAPDLAAQVQQFLRQLAMAAAVMAVEVEGESGAEVCLLLAANSGSSLLPLAKVASGGELARVMLALRQVITKAPPTMVFDEVDAGVGGEAAHSIGAALASLAEGHQVLVVTHLAQVAACADQQLKVNKVDDGQAARASVEHLDSDQRIVELSRMLSGSPDSSAAQQHAAELLAAAAVLRPS